MNSRSENKVSLVNSLRVAFVVLAIAATTVSCTKKKPVVDETGSEARVAKSAFEGKRVIVSRGAESSASTASGFGAIPGISADFGVTRVEITEKSLRFIKDYGVNNVASTADVLLAFPIEEHFDIINATNDFGDQTHKIVKDSKKPWNERAYMRVAWATPSIGSIGLQAGDGRKVEEQDPVMVEPFTQTGEQMNFATKVTIDGSQVVMRTQFVEAKKSDFEALAYSKDDFNKFGLFYTEHENEDEEGDKKEENKFMYAELFNVCEASSTASCSKNKIVWHLNKGFPDRYLEKTRQAVREWNETFQAALDRKDDVVVLDESKKADMTDATKNVIAYYEEETNGGLLGVAQGTVDWATGEKLSARATTYGDGIRGTLQGVDAVIDLLVEDQAAVEQMKEESKETKTIISAKSNAGVLKTLEGFRASGAKVDKPLRLHGAQLVSSELNKSLSLAKSSLDASIRLTNKAILNPLFAAEAAQNQNLLSRLLSEDSDKLKTAMSESVHRFLTRGAALRQSRQINGKNKNIAARFEARGAHSSEVVEEAAIRYIQKLLKDGMSVSSLNANRAAIKEHIAQLTYYTTLLHEMGHTFGLRHNFAGSADEKNFVPQYEQLQKLIGKDKNVKASDLDTHMYSSIMDYHADFYSGDAGLGPYDKAAIRYAYNRSLNKETDEVVGKKKYLFCTDGQAGESVLCRRFDKGTTVAEITKHHAERMKRRYVQSHFRRGRSNYISNYSDYVGFQQRIFGQYAELRQSVDELIYGLQAYGYVNGCPALINKGVSDKELENICDGAVTQKLGMTSLDVSQLLKAIKPLEEGEKYKAGGFADLIEASAIAMQLYIDTIGAPLPGIYLAQQTEAGDWELALVDNLSEQDLGAKNSATIQNKAHAALLRVAQQNGVPADKVGEFVQANAKLINVLTPANGARFIDDQITTDEFSWLNIDRLGYEIDKQIAMSTLALRDLGAMKYSLSNIQGNAYLWMHTTNIVHDIFESVMSLNPKIAARPIVVPDKAGKPMLAYASVDAGITKDMQVSAMVLAMTQFSTIEKNDFSSKIKIYKGADPEIAGVTSLERASFTTNSDGKLYTAFQSPDGKSIAFKVVAEAKKIADRRDTLLALKADPIDALAKIEKSLSENDVNRASAEASLAAYSDASLKKVSKSIFGKDGESVWSKVKASLVRALDPKMDINKFVQDMQVLYQAQQAATAQVSQALGKRIRSPKDQECLAMAQQIGSSEGLGPECKNVVELLKLGAIYRAAVEPLNKATVDAFDVPTASGQLPGVIEELNGVEEGVTTLKFLQELIGMN